jgi:peroxiredoxin
MKIASSIVALLAAFGSVSAIDVGDTIPADLTLHHGFPPERISLDGRLSGKNVLLLGLPGAFTPT